MKIHEVMENDLSLFLIFSDCNAISEQLPTSDSESLHSEESCKKRRLCRGEIREEEDSIHSSESEKEIQETNDGDENV